MFRRLIYLLLFFAAASGIRAEINININDTTLVRGIDYRIPVYADLNESEGGELEIGLRYSGVMLHIKSVAAGTQYLMQCDPPQYSTDLSIPERAALTVACGDLSAGAGELFAINLEGLAGPDTLTWLVVEYVKINGEIVSDLPDSALITIPGSPVQQTFPENIGLCYPNPFGYEARIPFSISKTTDVSFYIYNLAGEKIQQIPGENDRLRYHIIDSEGNSQEGQEKIELARGKYTLYFEPDILRMSMGMYVVIMKTESGVYRTNFMYIR
ncbi:MAG: hypothetical protein ACLFQX_11130 [Candidatus Kapaibacterium sp.]